MPGRPGYEGRGAGQLAAASLRVTQSRGGRPSSALHHGEASPMTLGSASLTRASAALGMNTGRQEVVARLAQRSTGNGRVLLVTQCLPPRPFCRGDGGSASCSTRRVILSSSMGPGALGLSLMAHPTAR